MASCAVPGFMPSVEWEGTVLVDGGLIDVLPAIPAKKNGAEVVVGVAPADDVAVGVGGERVGRVGDRARHRARRILAVRDRDDPKPADQAQGGFVQGSQIFVRFSQLPGSLLHPFLEKLSLLLQCLIDLGMIFLTLVGHRDDFIGIKSHIV